MTVATFTCKERPEFLHRQDELETDAFPEFLLQEALWHEVWPHMCEDFGEFQIYLYDTAADTLLGCANTVPLAIDNLEKNLPGFQELLLESVRQNQARTPPNTLCWVQAIVVPKARGRGLASKLHAGLVDLARAHGIETLAVPLRPSLKDRYPLTPIERYAEWRRDDGLPFDPWMRTYERLGAQYLGIRHDATVIADSIEAWENWTGMKFPDSGDYIVPGAHTPLSIDCDHDVGRYTEAHIWYRLSLQRDPASGP